MRTSEQSIVDPDAERGFDDAKEKIVELAVHRSAFDARFPKVDDILDRLSSAAQKVVMNSGRY